MTTIKTTGGALPSARGQQPTSAETPTSESAATTSASTKSDELHPPIDAFDDGPGTSSRSSAVDPRVSKPVSAALSGEVSALRAVAHAGGHRRFGGDDTKPSHVINGDGTANKIHVAPGGKKGGLAVTVDGVTQQLNRDQASRLVIRGHAGNDDITVDPRVKQSITIEGGEGDDTITGGSGKDMIKGGAGKDTIDGGAGGDYIDGGAGNDVIKGGAGNDSMVGGRGDDALDGGAGKNVLVGGQGKDSYQGGEGANRVIGELHEKAKGFSKGTDKLTAVSVSDDKEATQPGHSINVKGEAAFKAQVEDDLDALRSTKTGRALLSELDTAAAAGKPVTISYEEAGGSAAPAEGGKGVVNRDGTPGKGTGANIKYDPSDARLFGRTDGFHHSPSTVKLFHELVHAHHFTEGSARPVREGTALKQRVAGHDAFPDTEEARTAGVDYWRYGSDGDPMTKGGQQVWNAGRAERFSENKLRAELGLEHRTTY